MAVNKNLAVLLSVGIALLSGCGNAEESSQLSSSSKTEEMSKTEISSQHTEAEKASYEPSLEEIEDIAKTWVLYNEENRYRLILGKDLSAQLVQQDAVGNLLGLSHGSWNLNGGDSIVFNLSRDNDKVPFEGEYTLLYNDSERSLKLSPKEGYKPLINEKENVLYEENYEPQNIGLICEAVLNYYEAQSGEKYPGKASVEEITPRGVTVRLYEDMGDHNATFGIYTVDPVTFEGFDEIMNTEVNFAVYLGNEEIKQDTQKEERINVLHSENSAYSFPLINDETPDAQNFNRLMKGIQNDIKSGNMEYVDAVSWESFWNESLLSLVVKLDAEDMGLELYEVINYDFESGKRLSNGEVLSYAGVFRDNFTDALRRQAAEEIDAGLDHIEEYYDGAYEGFLELRAQTLSESNLSLENINIFLKENKRPCAVAPVATIASSGVYYKVFEPEFYVKSTDKRVELDFISAHLSENSVYLTFENKGLAGLAAGIRNIQFGKPYKVEGLYGRYKDAELGYMGNDGSIYLFLTDENGRVSFCDIFSCMMTGDRFIASGPLWGISGVKSCEFEEAEDGQSVYAVLSDGGKADLYGPVTSSQNTVHRLIKGKSWAEKGNNCSFTTRKDTQEIIFSSGGKTLGEGSFSYLGLTEKGYNYGFSVWTSEGMTGGIITLSVSTPAVMPEGEAKVSVKITSGDVLPFFNEDGEAVFYPAGN